MLIGLVLDLLEIECIKSRFKRENHTATVLDCFLSLRGLVLAKSKLTDEAGQRLLSVINLSGTNRLR